MCGIYGITALGPSWAPEPALLAPMAAATLHRGPDDEGTLAAPGIAMGMRRLAIIDLEGGHQPIANEDGTVHVVCNGEIYNFRELRRRLEGAGHRFRTGSDSEVLVHLYEEHGEDCARHLDGMFAFAIWDGPRRRLLLGRDRLGIKPLYLHRDPRRLAFASEVKALLTLPDVSRDLDPIGLQEYLTLGYTPTSRGLLRGIEKLPPASVLCCEQGRVSLRSYWEPPAEVDEEPDEEEWSRRVRARLERAVTGQLVSDVPLGAFLSGGIDSSAVVGLMAAASTMPVRTYSIGFDTGAAGAFYDELPWARIVARHFGTEHREILVRPDVVELLPKLLWHLDEPLSDSAFITTWLVSEFARREVTVILSGVGGDELFGGYRRYLGDHYARRWHLLPAPLRRRVLRPLLRRLPSDRHSGLANLARYARAFVESSERPFEERYRAYVQVFGAEELDRLLCAARRRGPDAFDEAFAAAPGHDRLNRLMRVDLRTQLPNDLLMLTDKMSMAASLECRVPFLDHELVEIAARIPARRRLPGSGLKQVLKRAVDDILPRRILQRRKRGFGAPMGAWLRRELSPLVELLLSPEAIARRGIFDEAAVREAVSLHAARRQDYTDHLLTLLNFEVWASIHLDGRAPEDLALELGERAR